MSSERRRCSVRRLEATMSYVSQLSIALAWARMWLFISKSRGNAQRVAWKVNSWGWIFFKYFPIVSLLSISSTSCFFPLFLSLSSSDQACRRFRNIVQAAVLSVLLRNWRSTPATPPLVLCVKSLQKSAWRVMKEPGNNATWILLRSTPSDACVVSYCSALRSSSLPLALPLSVKASVRWLACVLQCHGEKASAAVAAWDLWPLVWLKLWETSSKVVSAWQCGVVARTVAPHIEVTEAHSHWSEERCGRVIIVPWSRPGHGPC